MQHIRIFSTTFETTRMKDNVNPVSATPIVNMIFIVLLSLCCFSLTGKPAYANQMSETQISELIAQTEEIRRTDYQQFFKNIEMLKAVQKQLTELQDEQLTTFISYQLTLNGQAVQGLGLLKRLSQSQNINIRMRSYISQIPILTQLKKLNEAVVVMDIMLDEIATNDPNTDLSLVNEGLQVVGFFYKTLGEFELANSYYHLIDRAELSDKEICLLDYLIATNSLSAGKIGADDRRLLKARDFCYDISDLMMANGLVFAQATQYTKDHQYMESIDLLKQFENKIHEANYRLHLLAYDLNMMENLVALEKLQEAQDFADKIESYPELEGVKVRYYELLAKLKYLQEDYLDAHKYLQIIDKEKSSNEQLILKDKLAYAQVKHQVAEKNNRLNNLMNLSRKNLTNVADLTNENKALLDTLVFDKIVIFALITATGALYLIIFVLRAHKQGIRNNRNRDPLTGVYMRRHFTDLFASMVYKEKFSNQSLAVITFNFDKLKDINNRFSVEEGDYLLRQTVRYGLEIISVDDVLARIGSDEFAIAMPNKTKADAEIIAHRIAQHIKKLSTKTTGEAFQATASFGITDTQISNYVPKALLADSSKALSTAKHSEHKVCIFDSSMTYKTTVFKNDNRAYGDLA